MANSLPEYMPYIAKDGPEDAATWADWLEGFKAMLGAMGVEQDAEGKHKQFDLLWHYIGNQTRRTLKQLENNGVEDKSYVKAHKALSAHYAPTLNRIYQMHILADIKQGETESMDSFYSKVKERVDMMKLDELNVQKLINLITISQLVNNTVNKTTKKKALKDGNITVKDFLDHARTCERTEHQMTAMQSPDSVSYVKKGPSHKHKKKKSDKQAKPGTDKQSKQSKRDRTCKYCGKKCPKGNCPAFGKTCGKCGKKNHYASVCRSSKTSPHDTVHKVDDDECEQSDSDQSIYMVQSTEKKRYFTNVLFKTPDGDKKIKLQLDTGATCSTLTLTDYEKLSKLPPRSSNAKLKLYHTNVSITPVGCCTYKCVVGEVTKKIHFEVIKDAPVSLLSANACKALGLITFKEEYISLVTHEATELTEKEVLKEYADVFKGLGKLPGEYHIQMNPGVKPSQANPRRIGHKVKPQVKAKLDELEKMGVVSKVNKPTEWISSMVVVKKPNKLRICIDPQPLNVAIERNHYMTPTLEEIAPRFKNAKVFSVLDAKDGFNQVVLDEESSYLTTFWTPWGRYRWLRMPFGIKSAPEEFQRHLDTCLEGLENVAIIADDIIIFGQGDTRAEAVANHDQAFRKLMNRCREKSIKLNKKKMKLKLEEVTYMGHRLTTQGLLPDPVKVQAVTEMQRPTDVAGVQRLLGVVTYLSKFLAHLSTICEPLRRLTDKEAIFDWLPKHEEAFQNIKTLITQAPVLHYYDPAKEVTIECDSSEVGMGAVITQEGHPVAFASRALTSTERNYAQIEKECLAIVFATQRFDEYILGMDKVTICTDHKPLTTIFKKPILSSPKRLQRMRLRLQRYPGITLLYKPGPQMYISDTLSRASLPIPEIKPDMPEDLIYSIKEEEMLRQEIEDTEVSVFVTDDRLQAIREATHRDVTLQTLMNVIMERWPGDKTRLPLCIRDYWPYRDEMTVQEGLVFRGERIVIPCEMRKLMTSRAHAAHMGLQYTINTAREIMYWPKMHNDLTEAVRLCNICQESQPAQTKEPMMTYPLPKLPWQVTASDVFELCKSHYVVLVDTHSDYVEV